MKFSIYSKESLIFSLQKTYQPYNHVHPDRSRHQVLRGVQRQHSQEAEDHRRVSELHLLHRSCPVRLLLSGRNIPLQCFPLGIYLQRCIICVGGLSQAPGKKIIYSKKGTILNSYFQVNPANKSQFAGISPERAFADFIFAHVILHLIVMNFIG